MGVVSGAPCLGDKGQQDGEHAGADPQRAGAFRLPLQREDDAPKYNHRQRLEGRMSKVERLLELASFSRHVEKEFIAELPQHERRSVGTPKDWSAKDLVSHVSTWRERGAAELREAVDKDLPPEPEEFDDANRAIFEQNQGKPWEAVLLQANDAWEAYLRNLAALPEERLTAVPAAGQPLWRRVTVDAGSHPILHYAEFTRRRGRGAFATRWMEQSVPHLLAVDESPEWQGVVHYNLACHYAQSGVADKALESLGTALGFRPGLRQWSTQDSDLAPLHGDPRFSTLTAEPS
jgi:hypothetical protein